MSCTGSALWSASWPPAPARRRALPGLRRGALFSPHRRALFFLHDTLFLCASRRLLSRGRFALSLRPLSFLPGLFRAAIGAQVRGGKLGAPDRGLYPPIAQLKIVKPLLGAHECGDRKTITLEDERLAAAERTADDRA